MNRELRTPGRLKACGVIVLFLAAIGLVAYSASGCAVTAMPAAPASTVQQTATAATPLHRTLTATPRVSKPATPAGIPALATAAAMPGLLATATPPAASGALPTPTPMSIALGLPTPTPLPIVPIVPIVSIVPIEPTPDGVERSIGVPILMYHYVSTPPPDADIYRTDLSVPPALFAEHLDRLQAEGYTTISLYDLTAFLTQGTPLPDKPVIISFDDGYRDNYANAFRLLKERGMTATFFVVTDFIDEQRPDYLSWDMAREMLAGGMSIESHGRNHVSLAGKDSDYLVWQTLGSLETIQYELGVRPRFISYPAGEYDQRTLDVVQSAGYWAGVTTQQGATHTTDDPFELARVRVRNTTTPDKLAELLQAGW